MKTVLYAGREIPWKQRPLEKVVQKNCVTLLRYAGFVVGSTSQYRASHVTEGMSDLHLFHEQLVCSGWWETKRPGEALTPDQVTWRKRCLATRTLHGWGTDEDLKQWLVVLGVGHMPNGVFGIRNPGAWPDGRMSMINVVSRIMEASQLH